MISRLNLYSVFLAAILIAACGRGSDDTESAAAEPEKPALPTFMVFVEPTEDVAAWNARYEANASARATHGMSEVLTAEDIDHPGTVMVIQSVEDATEAFRFVGSDAAVLAASPDAEVLTVRMLQLGDMPGSPVAIVVILDRVPNHDEWLNSFERGAAARSAAGLYLAGFGRDLENKDRLFQAYFATDLEAARGWVAGTVAGAGGSGASGLSGENGPVVRFVEPIN